MLFNEDVVLKFTGGDREIAKSITDIFSKECGNYISGIKSSLENQDCEQLKEFFHKIKTSSGFSGSTLLEKESEVLFILAEKNDLESVKIKCQTYLTNLAELNSILEKHVW
ncbi:MAG: hypothetical protein COA79_11750 [Planctomycetota bacterium]|nr:MAG: hypothetical protein COA79_11750 [Planctomycetota bacterium]